MVIQNTKLDIRPDERFVISDLWTGTFGGSSDGHDDKILAPLKQGRTGRLMHPLNGQKTGLGTG